MSKRNKIETRQLPAIPLDDWALGQYMHEIARQWQAVEDATELYNQLVRPRRDHRERLQLTFFVLQSFLGSSGMVSKLLWPVPHHKLSAERKAWAIARGAALRAALGVPEDSILKQRNVRNALEHFDEGLDEWLTDGLGRNVVDFAVMSPSSISISGQTPEQTFMRLFDPDTFTVWILGTSVQCKDLHNAVYEIGLGAKSWLLARGLWVYP